MGSGVFSTQTLRGRLGFLDEDVSVPVWALGSFLLIRAARARMVTGQMVSVPVWALGSFLPEALAEADLF